jgi:hypothetical protein
MNCWRLFGTPTCSSHWLTGNHYRYFLSHDLPKLLEDGPMAVKACLWFMHEGAPEHFRHAVQDVFSNMNLIKNILSTFYKCPLSTLTHKLNISGHIWIRTFFLVLVCGTHAPSLPTPFSHTLHTAMTQ